MTSYRPPDFDLIVDMTTSEFNAIAGIAYSVELVFVEDSEPIAGMLILPQGNDLQDSSTQKSAWLWCDDAVDMGAECRRVIITLRESCDPMLSPDERRSLDRNAGLVFSGNVQKRHEDRLVTPSVP